MLHLTDKGKQLVSILLSIILIICTWHGIGNVAVSAASKISISAKVIGNNVYIRKTAGRQGELVTYNQNEVKLNKDQAVTIKGQEFVDGEKWYRISFKLDQKSLSGYMHSDYIKLTLKTSVKAKVNSSSAQKVRTKAGKNTYLKVDGKVVTLAKGKSVRIKKETKYNSKKWFYVSFSYHRKTYKGYIQANALTFVATEVKTTPKPTVQSQAPIVTKKPAVTKTPVVSKKPAVTKTPVPSKKPSETKTPSPTPSFANTLIGKTGVVTANALNVRTGAGTSYGNLMWNSSKVQIIKGTGVLILDCEPVNQVMWYKVSFHYQGKTLSGFVCGSYIEVDGIPVPSPSVVPSTKPGNEPTKTPMPSVSHIPLSDKQFEEELKKQGFPEDYRSGLRNLHEKYPLWQFKTYKVGYSWDTAISKESVVGKNLITKSKASGWKSFEKGAYNWSTDSYIPFDGSTWVTASKQAIEYYMDPRNFLTTDGIFQFEYLGYEPEYQTESGVESILKNTVLHKQSYVYEADDGDEIEKTYGETFIDAADYSRVNPFHLATRVKQEVVTSKGLSSSATGTFSGYTGYYNFYNIGATHSTAPNGAIINGLKFAKSGGSLSAANKLTYLIPWNSQYNAIVGGAKYIGNNYINRGQNTVYLQKFNLSSYSTFSHQYMANVEAAKAEAQKTYTAYQNFTDIPVVFYIPVYDNMPAKPAPVPGTQLNPNNWLKSLTVSGSSVYTMTPTFKIANDKDTTYTVMVDSKTTSVKINATSVSSFASITGTGTKELEDGTNTFKIKVTAQNGDVRTYIIYVIKA